MRKVVLLMHTTLDGYCAGPNGEMDWIKIDDDIFDMVSPITQDADTALYGRVTYGMMEGYWPTAGSQPNASKHDIEHSNWTNAATKLVFSRTMKTSSWQGTRIISDNIAEEIQRLKQEPGKNMLLIGSVSIAQYFIQHNLIDEYWLNVNPVVLGQGMPLFKPNAQPINLKLLEAKTHRIGVVTLRYETVR